MPTSSVYFAAAGGRHGQGPIQRVGMLFEEAGFTEVVRDRDLVALKCHFGERGNTSFVPPPYIRAIVEKVVEAGGRPFLTDTGCLYFSGRANARDHLLVASEHGFSPETTTAPVLIADGLRGSDVVPVKVKLKHFETVEVAAGIHDANSLIVCSHVTGHGLTGFAATIKNLGMGAGGRKMKLAVHDMVRPALDAEKCDMCQGCLENCPAGAVSVIDGEMRIDTGVCIGCGECMAVCPNKAIDIKWKGRPEVAQEKLAEITCAVLANKKGRAGFMSFLINVTPTCDCWNFSAAPMVPDIGYLASTDPIAIDQAAADLVNGAIMTGTLEGGKLEPRAPDKFLAACGTRWERQLEHGEKLGLGTRSYELVRVGD